MSEVAEYEIGGQKYTQSFLTIEQSIKFFKEIKGIKIKDISDIPGILETLVESGWLKAILEIVLTGPKPIDLNQIKPALLLKIVGDFFLYNDLLDLISTVSDIFQVLSNIPGIKELAKPVSQKKSKSPTGIDSLPPSPTGI